MELLWWADAEEVMTRLEGDRSLGDVLMAVRRTLGRLERDPYDPHLRTRQFGSDRYGQVRATPTTHREWWIFWKSGPEPDQITVVTVPEVFV